MITKNLCHSTMVITILSVDLFHLCQRTCHSFSQCNRCQKCSLPHSFILEALHSFTLEVLQSSWSLERYVANNDSRLLSLRTLKMDLDSNASRTASLDVTCSFFSTFEDLLGVIERRRLRWSFHRRYI